MKYTLSGFTVDSFQSAKQQWIDNAISNNLPITDYEKIIEWAEKRIDYGNKSSDSYAYGIFCDKTQVCVAVVDIVYTKRGNDGWLKMLTVNLAPDFITSELEAKPIKLEDVLYIYIAAAIGTIKLTSNHKARTIKLYGRNDPMLSLLVAMKTQLSNDQDLLKISISLEGRWLVITTT